MHSVKIDKIQEIYQVSMSERKRELRRRRKRREKVAHMKSKLDKADSETKTKMAEQLRRMTVGAEVIIKNWGLEQQ